MPSVYIKTLGCKVNTYDSNLLETQFKSLGYELVDNAEAADVTVVNTCSVTANADKESRYLFRRYRRDNPESVLVATGCYAQTDSAAIAEMDEVNFVVPNEIKENLVSMIHEHIEQTRQGQESTLPKFPATLKPVSQNRQGHFKTSLNLIAADSDQTRAFLKIQDGCNGFCTYCLIPYARGASRSVERNKVLTEVRRLIDSGVQEIVFTGIHIGDYGVDLADAASEDPFVSLIAELFSWPDMVRLRISSLEPRELSEELLKVVTTRPDIFCDHFHLPLQSGSDRILKKMRRTYTSQEYADKVAMARAYLPNVNIGADVIPGFPGETEEDFAATVAFIERLNLNYLHVFPYSRRPNTAADKMPEHLDVHVVKERSQQLSALSRQLKQKYYSRFIGQRLPVLWEQGVDQSGRRLGKTSNYLEVAAPGHFQPTPSQFSLVTLKGFTEHGHLLGAPVLPI